MKHDLTPLEAETRLWSEIGHARFGMLGLAQHSSGSHFQPMTAFGEPDTREIWFYTRRDSALARAVADDGADAVFLVQSKDQDVQASITGSLRVKHDQAHIERHWNAMVAAWFPGGKQDPMLTLLRFEARDAEVWITQGGPVKLAWEVSKALATHKTPDVGDHARVELTASRLA